MPDDLKVCPEIDLRQSLGIALGNRPGAAKQLENDYRRQFKTAQEILDRFSGKGREFQLLADEVGLGKTFVALCVGISILAAIRQSSAPEEFPQQRPAVLILTPNNQALYNKWRREIETFRKDCAASPGAFSWLEIGPELAHHNVIDLGKQIRTATKSRPQILVAKMSTFGSALHEKEDWRRRALAALFQQLKLDRNDRQVACRKVLGSGAQDKVPELLDLRGSYALWADTESWATDLSGHFMRVAECCAESFRTKLIAGAPKQTLKDICDDLTRAAICRALPTIPLVIIDEIHNLKNPATQTHNNVRSCLRGGTTRLLGLSATPFQLKHEELLNVLKLRSILSLGAARHSVLNQSAKDLRMRMSDAREASERFRRAWQMLRPADCEIVQGLWERIESSPEDWKSLADDVRPQRVGVAFEHARTLERTNRALERRLREFVVRHRVDRSYRRYMVGRDATADIPSLNTRGFEWQPGLEARGKGELANYLLMRAVSLSKRGHGSAGLGAEVTGSYRHLFQTAVIWKKLGVTGNDSLLNYRHLLEKRYGNEKSDFEHPKILATARRALEAFTAGQKTLIFCIYVKTAEAIRDVLNNLIAEKVDSQLREGGFSTEQRFENFRNQFFSPQRPLYSLVQDHPLLANIGDGALGVPHDLQLGEADLARVADLLIQHGEFPQGERTDRRLLLAAVEHVAISLWRERPIGREWLRRLLGKSPELEEQIARISWLPERRLLSAPLRVVDPAAAGSKDELRAVEESVEPRVVQSGIERRKAVERWVQRLRNEVLGDVIALYFDPGLFTRPRANLVLPLLPLHHGESLAALPLPARRIASNVFRRMIMAKEFFARYLLDGSTESDEIWARFLARRYDEPHLGHRESLKDRVAAYLETLARASVYENVLEGYFQAVGNRNVVQLVTGGMDRDRYFLGFNTPYRPEILIATSVGEEGIDLHRECRHVIHHDLPWNPATLEQRTGRIDRIGSKLERERAEAIETTPPTLDVAIPYVAATYDERVFQELHRRSQLFEVTLGGDFRVDGKIDAARVREEKEYRRSQGIGTPDEDLGNPEIESGFLDLPAGLVDRLRIDLAVFKV